MAQTAIASIGTCALLTEVNWLVVLSASVLAGILSILTSLAGLPEVKLEQENLEIKQEIEEKNADTL